MSIVPGRLGSQRTLLVAVALLCVFATYPPDAIAKDGRDFSAMYDITDVVDVDALHVSLTLILQIQNHSGALVRDATVLLQSGLPAGEVLGSFSTPLNAADAEVIRLGDSFVVPRGEYERWQAGFGPRFSVSYVNASGGTMRRPVEVLRLPGLGAQP